MSNSLTAVSSGQRVQIQRLESMHSLTATRSSNIDRLSDPLLTHVFEYLCPGELLGAKRVSTRFLKIFEKWTQKTTVLDLNAYFVMERLRTFFEANSFPRVTHLIRDPVSGSAGYGSSLNPADREFIASMPKKCPNVTQLSLNEDPYCLFQDYLEAFGKNLRVLDVHAMENTVSAERLKLCPNLEELRVKGGYVCHGSVLEKSLVLPLVELEVFFGEADLPDPENNDEELWDVISKVVDHCQKPENKLTEIILTIRGPRSYLDGTKIKQLLSCKKLEDLSILLRRDCLNRTVEIESLLSVLHDKRLSFYPITPEDARHFAEADPEESPWDKQMLETNLRQIILEPSREDVEPLEEDVE